MPEEQRNSKKILGKGCGGLDETGVWRVGQTGEYRLMYGRSIMAATSGN